VTSRRIAAALLIAALAAVSVPSSAPAAYSYGARVMKMGSKGKDVRKLQKNLTALGYPTPTNGVYGLSTKRNVKKLERKRGWKIDGMVSRKDASRISKLVYKRKSAPTAKYFLNGLTVPTLTVSAAKRGDAVVAVKDTVSGETVDTLGVTFESPGTQDVRWGAIVAGGGAAPESKYRMSVSDPGTAEAAVAGGQKTAFDFYWHTFPLPGPHDYGGKGSRFGADRGDHIHQGQDMSASCGEKLYVATGGTVTAKAYQAGGAGYYIVIKGWATGGSYVYMHMIKASWAQKGQVVYTGQQIGKVGNTGSSSGCHLHFERWTAPGWYTGGKAYDPLPELTYWDSYS
jgi:murein DD-endopeptidase MepM/ murein hydrolase activator NlpD